MDARDTAMVITLSNPLGGIAALARPYAVITATDPPSVNAASAAMPTYTSAAAARAMTNTLVGVKARAP